MADNVSVTPGAGATISTDDVGGVQYQRVKVDLGGDGVSSPLVRGQQTQANSLPVVMASDQSIHPVRISDGTDDVTVSSAGARKPMDVHLIDAAGSVISSFGGAGGTSAADDADFSAGATQATPIQGVYEPSPTSVTADDMGIIGIDQNRRVKVSVDASTLDVAHDAVSTGNPVLIGHHALSAMPTAVASGDRSRSVSDLYGRQLVAHIDPGMQVTKQTEYTATQTGTTIWDPTSGKRIAITSYQLGTGGATAALVTLWFGDNADTTFTQGTDQVLFRGTLTPSASSTPGVISNLPQPVFCTTADRELHITTSAGITLYVTIYGYEW